MAKRQAAIVGVGLSDYPKAPHLDSVEHHALAFRRAIADSGVDVGDIDGYMAPGGDFKAPDNSGSVADPLHLFDCCVVSDGGGAIIITTDERAKDLRQPPVYVLGAATQQTHWQIASMPDFTVTGAKVSGEEAFRQAQVTPDDI